MIKMTEGNVVSPVFGVINQIHDQRIEIYIPKSENHHVYAPISGLVSKISQINGHWIRQIRTEEFIADIHKTGRVTIEILSADGAEGNKVKFWLEVGKGYITDRIKLYIDQGQYVTQGQIIGEIVLGSLAEVDLPFESRIMTSKNQKVIGGQTIIAKLP